MNYRKTIIQESKMLNVTKTAAVNILFVLAIFSIVYQDPNNSGFSVFAADGSPAAATKSSGNTEEDFLLAVTNNDLSKVQSLINQGINVNKRFSNEHRQFTVLLLAAKNGLPEVVKILLDNGADPNIRDNYKHYPLMEAARFGHLESVKLLLTAGARVDARNRYDKNILQLVLDQEYDIEIVRLLLENGADPNIDVSGVFSSLPIMVPSWNGDVKLGKLLLANGADVNNTSPYGFTALMVASKAGEIEIAKLLIESGADVNRISNFNQTALIQALRGGYVNLARLLVREGAEVKYRDKSGKSALDYAEKIGDENLLRELERIRKDN